MAYEKTLEDLRIKREALDEAIRALEKLNSETDTTMEVGLFVGMTVAEAAKKYIKMMRRPVSTNELVKALDRGGLRHDSKDLYSTVYAILRQRATKQKDFIRVATDWSLPDLKLAEDTA